MPVRISYPERRENPADSARAEHALDTRGAILLRQKWSRGQVEARLANMSPCLIGMEACVGAHHLSRKLKAAWSRCPVDAGEVRAALLEGAEERLPRC